MKPKYCNGNCFLLKPALKLVLIRTKAYNYTNNGIDLSSNREQTVSTVYPWFVVMLASFSSIRLNLHRDATLRLSGIFIHVTPFTAV